MSYDMKFGMRSLPFDIKPLGAASSVAIMG